MTQEKRRARPATQRRRAAGLQTHGVRPSSWLIGAGILVAALAAQWVRLNISPSVPVGFYLLQPVPPTLTPGDLVVLPVPVRVRAWHSAWLPMLKPVAALAGTDVCVAYDYLWVAGEPYGPVLSQAQGMPLPHLEGCQAVPPDTVFLASHTPRSLDGRYFGMTPVTHLTARATPLWTWR